jgi:hypothetical protein
MIAVTVLINLFFLLFRRCDMVNVTKSFLKTLICVICCISVVSKFIYSYLRQMNLPTTLTTLTRFARAQPHY